MIKVNFYSTLVCLCMIGSCFAQVKASTPVGPTPTENQLRYMLHENKDSLLQAFKSSDIDIPDKVGINQITPFNSKNIILCKSKDVIFYLH